jgi:hypothetical protein
MSERKRRETRPQAQSASAEPLTPATGSPDDAERALGRAVAIGLPVASIVGALVVGFVSSVGSALLVLASGALLGTIALLWASVRTLSGDAPLPSDLEAMAAQRHGIDARAEHKRRVLRALKDLESEHAIGKIDDADYDSFVARYREEAKAVMREMDLQVAPVREQAEQLAREYLQRRGLESGRSASTAIAPPGVRPRTDGRIECERCQGSNEVDAAFCKQCGAKMNAGAEGNNATA